MAAPIAPREFEPGAANILGMSTPQFDESEHPRESAGGRFAVKPVSEASGGMDALSASAPEVDDVEPAPLPTYVIPSWGRELAEKKIAAANRRLERAGIAERFGHEWSPDRIETDAEGATHSYATLTLSHPVISYGGWEFVAALDATQAGMIVRTRPGADLGGWRPQESLCEHCNTVRLRNATYVVRHEDGTLMQVGSTCMTDFLGVKPSGLWAINDDVLSGIDDELSESHPGGSGVSTAAESRDVIAVALALTDGGAHYLSKAAVAYSGKPSTSDMVGEAVFGTGRRLTAEEVEASRRVRRLAEDYLADGTVDRVLAAAAAMAPGTDYADNMRVVAAAEHVSPRHAGILASAVSVWARENNRQAVRHLEAQTYVPGFLAAVDEKVAGHDVTVTKVVWLDNPYSGGSDTLLIMKTADGKTLKWKATGTKDLAAGDRIRLTGGRVKAHEQYADKDQTTLTRVKYETMEPAPANT